MSYYFFFFNDTATTEIYTLSLHDALPISARFQTLGYHGCIDWRHHHGRARWRQRRSDPSARSALARKTDRIRSEEHTSELQSRQYLVCRLLLEKKKNKNSEHYNISFHNYH